MPRFEDSKDGYYAARRSPGRLQVSRHFEPSEPGGPDRYAYQVFDSTGEVVFDSEDGWSTTLRTTPTRQQLKALFFEHDRHVSSLAIQRFNRAGKPIRNQQTVLLSGEEVKILRDFLTKIELVDLVGEEGVRISPVAARELLAGHELPRDLLRERLSDVVDFLRSDVSAPEVLALARRRAALETFEAMLGENRAEGDWQRFFEDEPWILGVAGAPQFLHRVGNRLESVVQGWDDIGTKGKRIDALLRTAGALSAFTFVEIKKPDTDLLRPVARPYRSGAWAVSDELAGGVAQVHATVDAAQRMIGQRRHVTGAEGYEAKDAVEFCRPRAVLVIGDFGEFINDEGAVHREKHRSFEAFRRSMHEPEIMTFDEVLHRARAVLAAGAGEASGTPQRPPPTE